MQEEDVVAADDVADLARRLEERQRLDVADGAADLGDDDVRGVRPPVASGPHPRHDLVGDVRDDLDRVAEVLAAALLGDDVVVDLAGGDVGAADEVDVEEALVVPDVEVGLGPVVGHEHLAVLERVHRPGVDVDVGVELLHRDAQAARPRSSRPRLRGGQPLAERGGDAPGHKDVLRRLRHGISVYVTRRWGPAHRARRRGFRPWRLLGALPGRPRAPHSCPAVTRSATTRRPPSRRRPRTASATATPAFAHGPSTSHQRPTRIPAAAPAAAARTADRQGPAQPGQGPRSPRSGGRGEQVQGGQRQPHDRGDAEDHEGPRRGGARA